MAAKLNRLQVVIRRRERWREELTSVRRMHTRVLAAEQIVCGDELRADGLRVSNATVGRYFAAWCARLGGQRMDASLCPTERRCLEHCLHVTDTMRPQLLQCDDRPWLPRTNTDMEGCIRAIQTRYRPISGRKNWNR